MLDVRKALVRVTRNLTMVDPFVDGPYRVPPAPEGVATVYEQPRGFADWYRPDGSGERGYVWTDWSVEYEPQSHSALPPAGGVIIGVRPAGNELAPEALQVTLALPVEVDGTVDMSFLAGSPPLQTTAGEELAVPSERITLKEAEAWFPAMLPSTGTRCWPLEAERAPDTESAE